MNIAERSIEIARERGLTTKELLQYDVAPSPVLFDDDGILTKPTKGLLIKELETHLQPEDYSYSHRKDSAFVLDVMATIRKVNVTKLSTFKDLLAVFFQFLIHTGSLEDVTLYSTCILTSRLSKTVRGTGELKRHP